MEIFPSGGCSLIGSSSYDKWKLNPSVRRGIFAAVKYRKGATPKSHATHKIPPFKSSVDDPFMERSQTIVSFWSLLKGLLVF